MNGGAPRPLARIAAVAGSVVLAIAAASTAFAAAGATRRARPDDLPPPSASADEINRAADRILAGREFRRPPENLFERARRWFFEQLAKVIDAVFSGERGTIAGIVVMAACLAVVAFVATRLLRRSGVARVGDEDDDDRPRPAQEWLAEAEAHEAAGEWRAAVRCRYRALVADLASRGLVDEVPGRTAGEYRSEVAVSVPSATHPFDEASDIFERAWYGNRPAEMPQSQRIRSLAEDVLAAAR